MKNDSKKPFEFTHEQSVDIEWVLVKSIELFHESPRTYEIKGYVQDYFVRYCYERDLPLKETIERANGLFRKNIHVEMSDIVPESKRGQAHLVNMTLITMLNKDGNYLDEEKIEKTVDKFCNLTGVSRDLTDPIVNTFVKWKKRTVIERELYDFLGGRIAQIPDEKDRKAASEETITAYAEVLKVTPQYIKGVLKNKKKKDEAEIRRVEEYRASKGKELPNNPDDNEAR